MKKILISMVVVGALVFGFTGCSVETKGSPPDVLSPERTETIDVSKETAAVEQESTSTLGDYEVVIKEAHLSEDYQGAPVIVIVYDWTNNSDETANATWSVNEKVFQDGVELESAYMVDGYDLNAGNKDVRPGTTLEVQQAFKLANETSVVEVEITELISWDDAVVYATFDPTALN